MKIRVRFCNAYSRAFKCIVPGSEHEVIEKRPFTAMPGCWVMGDGEPVYLLRSEYEEIKDE